MTRATLRVMVEYLSTILSPSEPKRSTRRRASRARGRAPAAAPHGTRDSRRGVGRRWREGARMAFETRAVDLVKLNSMTKYPSIPTYHLLGEKGALLDERVAFAGRVLGSEKVDGTNGRVIFLPDGCWIVGSREELLLARGDLIGNPALGIADALKG